MNKFSEEWFRQAAYDVETADAMFSAGRYPYVVFMCHLAIEKSLKGVFHSQKNAVPPKTHNLVYLLKETGLSPSEPNAKLLINLQEAGVVVRYPDDLNKIQQHYSRAVVAEILARTRELVQWIQQQ